jgi:hypothetical protein
LLGRSICWSEYQNFGVEFFLGFALKILQTFKESSACHRKHFHWCVLPGCGRYHQYWCRDRFDSKRAGVRSIKPFVDWHSTNYPTVFLPLLKSCRVCGVLIWCILLFMKCPWLSWLALQTDQLGRITNELDTIQFSIKKASQLVKEIGRQVCYLYRLIL